MGSSSSSGGDSQQPMNATMSQFVGIMPRLETVERELRSQLEANRIEPTWLLDACVGLTVVCQRQQRIIEMLAERLQRVEAGQEA